MKDNVKPGKKWEFNDEVARCFQNMLERSIPDYQSMRALSHEPVSYTHLTLPTNSLV